MAARNTGRGRTPWGMRVMALGGSVIAFVGFWQLAVRNPHPAAFTAGATPTPPDNYTLPTGHGTAPVALPTPPHATTRPSG